MNKVIAKFKDGRAIKGVTVDFSPSRDSFHITEKDVFPVAKPVEVKIKDLKALFFVIDYQGDPHRVKTNQFDFEKKVIGQKIKIVFLDGEVLTGTTTGYQSGRKGFFIVPADPNSNNERCYIVTASTKEITFL